MQRKNIQIALIVAMANDNIIGNNNALPWHLPADLQHFKHTTMGKAIIMGRKTWQSIGKALPGRLNIVISNNSQFSASFEAENKGNANLELCNSLEAAINSAKKYASAKGQSEIMIIGGANVYRQAIDIADIIYLSKLDLNVSGDSHFVKLDPKNWQQIKKTSHHQIAGNQQTAFDYHFIKLQRKT